MKRRLFFLVLLGLCIFRGPLVSASPQVTNTVEDPNTFVQHMLEQATAFRVGLETVSFSSLVDMNNAVDNLFTEYNGVSGSDLSISRGVDLSGEEGECDGSNVDALIDDPPYPYMIIACAADAFTQIGLGPTVLGATVTEVINGEIIKAIVLIKDGSGALTLTQVARHEGGHAVGLGHTPLDNTANPAALFPLVTINGTQLEPDDIFSIQSIYPTNPTDPLTYFATGACFTGIVRNQDGDPISGAVITAQDDNTPADPQVVAAISGTGFNSIGDLNGPGEYTLCGPAAILTRLKLNLCDIFLPTFNLTVVCGSELSDANSLGGELSMLRGVFLPYIPNGLAYAYTDAGTVQLNSGDSLFMVGTDITPAVGTFNSGFNFEVEAEFVEFPTNNFFFAPPVSEDGGCQAIGAYSRSIDLAMIILLFMPLGYWLRKKLTV